MRRPARNPGDCARKSKRKRADAGSSFDNAPAAADGKAGETRRGGASAGGSTRDRLAARLARRAGNPADPAAGTGGADAFDELARALNLHDLCEVPVAEGRILPGELVRCAKLDDLAASDWQTLAGACPLGLVVDLRTEAEIPERSGLFGSAAKGAGAPCATVNLALEGLGLLMPQWQRPLGPAWVLMRRKLWADPLPMFKRMYAAIVLDPGNMRNMGRLFQLALSPRDGALAWHCAQGTDRTGIVAALLLEALGADRADIVEHYAACYAHSAPADPRPQLLAAYEAVEGAYGAVPTYLAEGLGATPDVRQALRERFLA